MKVRSTAPRTWRSGLGLLLLLLTHAAARAQAPVYRGDTLPVSSGMPAWFLDTIHHQAYMDGTDYWKLLPIQPVKDIVVCGGRTLVVTKRGYELWSNPQQADAIYDRVLCADESYFCVSEAEGRLHWLNTRSTYNFTIFSWLVSTKSVEPQVVAGQAGYCVPLLGYCSGCLAPELKAWGIMSATGDWLIQPEYDQPFRFKRGYADVVYYGQRRRINEKGTTVATLDKPAK